MNKTKAWTKQNEPTWMKGDKENLTRGQRNTAGNRADNDTQVVHIRRGALGDERKERQDFKLKQEMQDMTITKKKTAFSTQIE